MLSKVRKGRKGFTLIELMIVVAIIGILAAIAIPQFAQMRLKGMNAAAKSALANLARAQDAYHTEHGERDGNWTYATQIDQLVTWYTPEEGVEVTIVDTADADSWSAYASHTGSEDVFTYSSSEGGLQ